MTASEDDTIVADPGTLPTAEDTSFVLSPGAIFAERYRIEALLGRGGMGAVYRVHDEKLDETVALKLLTLGSERAQQRFVSEVRLARRVTHPNVARTHDFGEVGDTRFLTMEYVPGTTLDQIIEQRAPLPLPALVALATPITAGLQAAHAAGVVHRDLKPANVLVGHDERVVITDFGIARVADQSTGTMTAEVVGTPHYMAPEQVIGKATDARSDLYALGIILYEMATGTLPFQADSVLAIALARVQSCPVDPRTHHPVGDPLASLILWCMAREPEARPASAQVVHQALQALVGEAPAIDESPAIPVQTPTEPYAPLSPSTESVAILPFTFRGPPDHAYLGDALAEELVDVLSHTRGLRVLSLAATRRFADDRDPSAIGEALEVSTIIDGTVQHAGAKVRLSVRMIDPDGTQRWSERYAGGLEDVFALQESLGRRVAEALRVELVAAAHRSTAPQEAIEHYLRARRMQRKLAMIAAEEAIELLDRAIELAPDFGAALAAHAIASVRAWWGYDARQRDQGHADRARRSVARALHRAPGLAETHLAEAMWEVQGGGFIAAARALGTALEIAPTMAEAHQYLGQLQCEAANLEEGKRRLELALELDPSLHLCRYTLARAHHFLGDDDASRAQVDTLWRALPGPPLATMLMRFRLCLYRGDLDEAREVRSLMPKADGPGPIVHVLTGLVFGETSPQEAVDQYRMTRGPLTNGRFTTLMRQIATELFATAGATELALRELTAAADSALIDLTWLRHCPLLDPLRGEAAFERAEIAVERRVAAIWR